MTPVAGPVYKLGDLVCECGKGSSVVVWSLAVGTARSDFGLATEGDIRTFINGGGLESPNYINTEPLGATPNPAEAPLVDGYSFLTGKIQGYLAFYRGPSGRWVIKSFKKSLVQDAGKDPLTHSPFKGLFPKPAK
jgi:hypothetical protein